MSGKTQRRTSNTVNPNDSVAGCILAHSEERPSTPDAVKPFRALSRNEPGTVFVHRGLVESGIPRDERFGLATNVPRGMQSDGLKELLSGPESATGSGLRGFTEEVRESVYKSHKAKPLGHSALSGTQLPEKVLQPDFRHGIPTVESESSKTVIFSGSDTVKQSESPNQYSDPELARKFEAEVTQPLDRHYDWAAARIDPATHRFGVTHAQDSSTEFRISNALPSAVSEHQSQLIASRQVEAEELSGRAGGKRSAELLSTLPKDYAFGSKPIESNDWDAKKCMHGGYSEEDQQPDKDLGKSRMSLKSQQFMPSQAGAGTFGVKTIRNDKASPTLRSIADTTNYGDEPGVKSLVQRSNVAETEFSKPRPASEVRVIFESSGHKLTDQEFDQLSAQAVRESGVLSVHSFRSVFNKLKLGIASS